MDLDNKYSSSKYVFIGVGIIRYWDTFVNISSKFWSPVSGSPDKVLNTNNICYSAFKDENDYFKTLDPVSDITMSQCAFYIKLKYNNETVPQKLIEFIENKDKTLQEISDSYDILTETADYSDGWIESSMALVLKSLIEIKLTYEQLELFRTGDLVIEGNSKCTLGQIIKHLEDYSTIRTKLSSRVVEMSTKCSKTCNYYRQEQKSLITDASISREEYDREQEYYGSQIKETLTSTLQYYKKIWHIIKDNSMLSKIKISNLSSTFTDTKVTEAFANVLEEMENFKLQ
jgi:hypothetical protein